MSNKFWDANLFNKFIKSLKNIGIKTDFIFLLLNYINKKGFILKDVLKIIEPALQELYPASIINLNSPKNIEMSMNEFMTKFCELCKLKRDEQFFEIQWDNDKNDFILTNKSLDEIVEIILGDKNENNQKNKRNMSDNFDVKDNTKFNRLTEKIDNSYKKDNKDIKDNNINLNESSKGQAKGKKIILDNKKGNLEGSKIKENPNVYSSKLINHDDKEEDDKNPKNKDKNDIDKDMLSTIEDLKKMIEMMQIKMEKTEAKYDELKEEKMKLKKEFSKELKEKVIKFAKILKEKEIKFIKRFEEIDKFSKKLSEQLDSSQQEVEDLKLNLKIIGLRTVYKSLINLLIYIFQLEDKGNLITKIESIKNI